MVVPKSDNFRERLLLAATGKNSANLAKRGDGAFRFHDEADELHHAAARFRDAHLAHAAQGVLQTAVGWNGRRHAVSDCRTCSILVSRRASTRPKRVWMTQPPRVTSGELENFSGPVSGRPSRIGD